MLQEQEAVHGGQNSRYTPADGKKKQASMMFTTKKAELLTKTMFTTRVELVFALVGL